MKTLPERAVHSFQNLVDLYPAYGNPGVHVLVSIFASIAYKNQLRLYLSHTAPYRVAAKEVVVY